LQDEEDKAIAKLDKMGLELKEMIQNGELKSIFEEYIEPAPCRRLELLWDIAVESDLSNLDQMEEMVYQYGSSLGAKNQLGRLLFVRMVFLLSNAKMQGK
jgi:hypothetical protein